MHSGSKRPYKAPWSVAEACGELRRLADAGKLDPHCVQAMEGGMAEVERIRLRYQDPEEEAAPAAAVTQAA